MSASRAIPASPAVSKRGDRILRYTLAERVNHWIGGLSYVYCLLSGLAFWSPYLYWMAAILGGGPSARFWHPWFGLVFTASMIWMLKMWLGDMTITRVDLEWKKAMPHYVRNEDEQLPPVGRFNYGQKIFFWVMFWSTFLLLLSGLGLWFVESIPPWLRFLSIVIHVGAALITIGAFIIHVYMGTAMVRGSFTSVIRGEVSTAWARMHHRLWYEQVTRQTPPQK